MEGRCLKRRCDGSAAACAKVTFAEPGVERTDGDRPAVGGCLYLQAVETRVRRI